jgi:hypothetical protein
VRRRKSFKNNNLGKELGSGSGIIIVSGLLL